MEPIIKSGELVTVEPASYYRCGDIVLCTVRGRDYLHLIKSKIIRADENGDGGSSITYVICNAKGHINGKTTKVYGRRVTNK